MKNLIKIMLAWLLIARPGATARELAAPVFENMGEQVTESGYVKLIWRWELPGSGPEGYEFELQQSENETFSETRTIYTGPDYATFLSGLKNGNYYHRVRVISEKDQTKSEWSDPVLVRVAHHSLHLALALFGMGAIVFLSTILLVMQGNRNANRNQS